MTYISGTITGVGQEVMTYHQIQSDNEGYQFYYTKEERYQDGVLEATTVGIDYKKTLELNN